MRHVYTLASTFMRHMFGAHEWSPHRTKHSFFSLFLSIRPTVGTMYSLFNFAPFFIQFIWLRVTLQFGFRDEIEDNFIFLFFYLSFSFLIWFFIIQFLCLFGLVLLRCRLYDLITYHYCFVCFFVGFAIVIPLWNNSIELIFPRHYGNSGKTI